MSLSAHLAGHVHADRLQWPHPQMLAAGGEYAVPRRVPDTIEAPGAARPADLRDAPFPAVIAERVAGLEREAYTRGFAEGQQAGEAGATARTEALFLRLEQTIAEIAAIRGGMVQRTEREVVKLAIAIAEHVLHRSVSANPAVLLDMARAAIARLGEHAAATIHLHPTDYDLVTRGGEPPPPGSAIALVADHHVPRGGGLVRSAFGSIDVSVDSQVREIARGLLGDEPQADTPESPGDASAR